MSNSPSEEAKELQLVGKVELKLALAESDEQLTKLLSGYLAPLLLKLKSSHPVRNKVIAFQTIIELFIWPTRKKALLRQCVVRT